MKWFRHDSRANRDAKLEKLMLKYGSDGYALYWLCLELISDRLDSDHADFELEHDAETLGARLHVDTLRVEEIMKYMVGLELFENDHNRITCLKLAARLENSIVKNPEIKSIQKALKSGKIPENSGQIRLDKNRIEESIKDVPKPEELPKEERHKYGPENNVMLTDGQYSKLEAELTGPVLEAGIHILSLYKASSGKRYKRDDIVIKDWVLKRLKEERPELFRKSTATPTKELDADILAVVQRANGGNK